MKEQVITYDIAHLAKDKGFNRSVLYRYDENKSLTGVKLGMHGNPNNYSNNYSAPTQSLLQKWLRENHNIEISVTRNVLVDHDDESITYVVKISNFNKTYRDGQILDGCVLIVPHTHFEGFKSYEEALEKGLEISLNLI